MAASEVVTIPRTPAYTERLAKEFQQLRADVKLADIEVQSITQSYNCHKVILAANSPVMKAKLRFDASETSRKEMDLKHIPSDVVEIILEYMYTGEVSIPHDQLKPVVEASEYLEMLELKELCLREAVKVLKPSNTISWYKLANTLEAEDLKSKLSDIISSTMSKLAKHTEFLELSMDQLNVLVSDAMETDADPDDLLEATLGWINHEADERVNSMEDLLKEIDLSKCSLECLEIEAENHNALLSRRLEVSNMINTAKHQTSRKWRTKMVAILGGYMVNGNGICWQMSSAMEIVELCEIPEQQRQFAVCKVPDGFVVTGGDHGCVMCSMFVLSTRSWVSLEPLQFARLGHASIFMNGKIFLFGGWVSDESFSYSVQSMKLDEGKWIDEPDIPGDYVRDPQVASVNASIFLFDSDNLKLLNFDVETNIWSRKADLFGDGCWGASIASVGGQLLVAGGHARILAQYNPSTDTWTRGNRPELSHRFGALASRGRKLYLIGGNDEDRIEEYDVDTESWSLCHQKLPRKLGYLYAMNV